MRLSDGDSQRVFRALLDTLANPGRPAPLGAVAIGLPPVAVPALALGDLDQRIFVAGPGAGPVGAGLARATGATIVDQAGAADMAVLLAADAHGTDLVASLRRGDAYAPELGARLFVACERLAPAGDRADGVDVRVGGPGATPARMVTVHGVDPALFAAIADANRSFPAGIDTWLVAADGTAVGLPRSCRLEPIGLTAGKG